MSKSFTLTKEMKNKLLQELTIQALIEVDELTETERGVGGFGSTGVA